MSLTTLSTTPTRPITIKHQYLKVINHFIDNPFEYNEAQKLVTQVDYQCIVETNGGRANESQWKRRYQEKSNHSL